MADFKIPKTTLEFALYYATLGWRIIPNHACVNGKCTCWRKSECLSPGKHPRFNEWQLKATTEPTEIVAWFKDYWPNSNIGVATGKASNLFLVDIDTKDGGVEKWVELIKKYGDIPPTPIAKTGSDGRHICFQCPSTITIPTKAKLFPGIGIDVRGEGGQAVLPPSRNANGNYEWCEDSAPWEVPVAQAPEWVLALISAASLEQGRESERFNVVRALCGVPEGERNHAITRLAASLRAQDFSYDTALTWILQAADNCNPPYPHAEAIKQVQWAYRKFAPGTSWKNVRRPYEQPVETVEWQAPVAFDELNLPAFPTHVFPGWVKNYVEAVAETTQTPVDMASMCALSVLATGCARKVRVFVTSDWSEPLNLFTVVCAPPGSRKGVVFRHMVEVIQEHESYLKTRAESEIRKIKAHMDLLESRYRSLRSRTAKAGIDEPSILEETTKILEKIAELEKKAILPSLIGDDITPQAIKTKLYEQSGRLAILSAEGDIFAMMNGRYQTNGEPDIDVYLKGHAGDDIRVNRISRREEDIRKPALTIGICTQTKSLRGLLDKTGLAYRGLYARFLYSMVEKEFKENMNPQTIPFRVFDVYRKNVRALLSIPYRESIEGETDVPHVLTLSSEAKELLDEFRTWINTQCRPGGVLATCDELKEWGAKLAGAVIRIAGLFHMAENIIEGCPWEWEIDARTFSNARELGAYFISHAIAAHEQMQSSVSHDVARNILLYIARNNKKQITKQDAVRCTKKHGRVIENALLYLMDRGFIRDANTNGRHQHRGQVFDVNPLWDNKVPERRNYSDAES